MCVGFQKVSCSVREAAVWSLYCHVSWSLHVIFSTFCECVSLQFLSLLNVSLVIFDVFANKKNVENCFHLSLWRPGSIRTGWVSISGILLLQVINIARCDLKCHLKFNSCPGGWFFCGRTICTGGRKVCSRLKRPQRPPDRADGRRGNRTGGRRVGDGWTYRLLLGGSGYAVPSGRWGSPIHLSGPPIGNIHTTPPVTEANLATATLL